MTNPKKPQKEVKTAALHARVTEKEHDVAEQAAWSQGVDLTTFVREAVRDAVRKAGGKAVTR